jgi:hypothetical protein
MRFPEGREFPGVGCCLEVVENRRLARKERMVK